MSDMLALQLEEQLTGLTAWEGPTPELWRQALSATTLGRKWGTPSVFRSQVSLRVVAGVAAAAFLITVGVFTYASRSNREQPALLSGPTASPASESLLTESTGPVYAMVSPSKEEAAGGPLARSRYAVQAGNGEGVGRRAAISGVEHAPTPGTAGGQGRSDPAADRQVIRKATIELVTKDVRAAFLKATQLISEARGEYVQDSGLTGDPNRMEGNLTLRVAAERLSEVLNELRELGQVRAEKSGGEDVTTQVVDLEARLRNEQRVEAEMLQLLEKRQDAPLKEILELRNAISGVRQTIEQLTGQRERLSRLVSLATVLVIIRPADAPVPPPPADPGLGAYFIQVLGHAWRDGIVFLMNTVVVLLSILVGGAIWWVLLVVGILWGRAYYRRRAKSTTA